MTLQSSLCLLWYQTEHSRCLYSVKEGVLAQAGLPDQSCVYRRGRLEFIDKNYLTTVFQWHYQNAMKDAIAQDAGLGCGTEPPCLDVLNHTGLKYNENAPNGVSDEVMLAIGLESEIRRVRKELSVLETEIAAKCGEDSKANQTG
ncbi:hypothetical protein MYCTH_90577 [Thermothelomyces thermophilus ATCC 42464]|uniref:Uncharacterized protein n=1 Tax=Thermothelomyces thermophilus (strain ATCC 42464 / BCRC 31852 / DSM 1799) TaxID=573729 RepID=G2QMK3_THET4|nr:uncharacterized protein MYCTH_90577 [Thermothelomyces thermophilus ATCC 42464]AEO61183.1 hypothetical protein MYCTH_90577 [Thermothelomyces thermophilus ATCC 42464]